MNTYTDTSVLCTTVMYGRAIATIAAAAYGSLLWLNLNSEMDKMCEKMWANVEKRWQLH